MSKQRYEIREVFNSIRGKNLYRLVLTGYCLLPASFLGAYDTLEEAKMALAGFKSAQGVVYSEECTLR